MIRYSGSASLADLDDWLLPDATGMLSLGLGFCSEMIW